MTTKTATAHSNLEKCMGLETCKGSMSPHLRCPYCQQQTRRATKRSKNNYRTHGPCQTPAQRAYRRTGRTSS